MIGGYGGPGTTRDFFMDVNILELDVELDEGAVHEGAGAKPRSDHCVCVSGKKLILSGGDAMILVSEEEKEGGVRAEKANQIATAAAEKEKSVMELKAQIERISPPPSPRSSRRRRRSTVWQEGSGFTFVFSGPLRTVEDGRSGRSPASRAHAAACSPTSRGAREAGVAGGDE